MILGFTGTRNGLTESQVHELHYLLDTLKPSVWLHGACVGADEDGVIAVRLRSPKDGREPDASPEVPDCGLVRVIALPGRSATGPDAHDLQSRIALEQSDEVRPVATHFARNRAIVDGCELLIACPGQMGEQTRGGTWYTIGYARKVGRPIAILWPDGTVSREP